MRITFWALIALGVLQGAGEATSATPCDAITTQVRAFRAGSGADQQGAVLARAGVQLDTGDWFDSIEAAFAALRGVRIDEVVTRFAFDERYLDRSQAPVILFDHRSDGGGFVALSQVLGSLGCAKMAILVEKGDALVPATGSAEEDCPIYEGSYFAVATVDGRPYPAVVESFDGGATEASIELYNLPVPDVTTEHALCSVALTE